MAGSEKDPAGESRREFIKRLPYIAPVVQSFFLRETAYGDDDDDKDKGNDEWKDEWKEGDDDDDDGHGDEEHDDEGRGRARGRRRVSPHDRGRD